MKPAMGSVCVFTLLVWTASAFGELQNVSVGGQVRIRGRYWNNAYSGPSKHNVFSPTEVAGRAVGPDGIGSIYDWGGRGDSAYADQRTVISVKADFTDKVNAYVELESFDIWGEDFRSPDYKTGVDTRANTNNDVEIFQSYVEMNELAGLPLSMRIGRQSIKLGKGWLVGDYYSGTGWLSFDGIRLTYKADALTVDAFWTKLAETMNSFGHGDVDFYAIYATYQAMESLEISAYYFYLRDDRGTDDSPNSPPMLAVWERLWGLNDYGATNLHTVGLRAGGKTLGFDYDLELAYQFGQADALGALFDLNGYGDASAEYSNWAGEVEAGYTFDDFACKPRVYAGGCYFGGDDQRDRSFWEYLNPLYRPEASVSFNRLFTSGAFGSIFDSRGGNGTFTNLYQVRAGVTGKINDSLTANASGAYYWVVVPWDEPANILASLMPWWTKEADNKIGLISTLWVQYNYSKDLSVKVGWDHLFIAGGMADGNFLMHYGTMFTGGTNNNDADYVFFDMQLKF